MIEVSNDKVVLCSFDAMGYLSVAFAIAIIPLSLILPEWISWENGPLEDLQVVVLALGVFLTAVFAKKACSKKIQHMWLAISGLFLLLIGRELSWGRVFFQTKMTNTGPEFIAMNQIPHHLIINEMILFFIMAIGVSIVYTVPWRKLLYNIPFPKKYCILAVIASLFSIVGDHGWFLMKAQGETMEELAELLVYSLLVCVVWHYYTWLEK